MKRWFFSLLALLSMGCTKDDYKPKVYDCFLFYNELELLEIRLHEMQEHVDKFVLVEASETFRGRPKPYYFEENKKLFEQFADKIIHVKIEEPFGTDLPFDREKFQRCQIARGLQNADPRDIVMISDVDEIVRGEKVHELAALLNSHKADAVVCGHTMYYGYLNRLQWEGWRGTVGVQCKKLKQVGAEAVRKTRDLEPKRLRRAKISRPVLIDNAGWHFTSMGGAQRHILKLESFSHDELDTPDYKNEKNLMERILALPLKPIDESFPRFVLDNRESLESHGFISK